MIAVLEKAMLVLEALDAADTPLGLAELARLRQMPKPTCYRILQSLENLGYVRKHPERNTYSPTTRLARLGHRQAYGDLRLRFEPLMQQLYDRFNETVNLGVLEGRHIRYVHVLETSRPLRLILTPGDSDPFYSTALGRAIVAYLPAPEQDRLLDGVRIKSATPRTITGRAALRQVLVDTRKRGWAMDDEENDLGVVCFAVPLIERELPVAAFSITLPTSRATVERRQAVVAALLAVAEAQLLDGYSASP